MRQELPAYTEALLRDVEHALEVETVRLMPRLVRLARHAPPGSWAWAYAHRLIAEETVEEDPWVASLFARRAVSAVPDDDAAWALLALAQSLLGNHRYAAHAYRRALALTPFNPIYAHNLGHLYDVALEKPRAAVYWLRRAFRELPSHPEVRASYAHALVRAGEPVRARALMAPLMEQTDDPHHHDLYRFIIDQDRQQHRRSGEEASESSQRRRRRKRRRTAP